MPSVGFETAIPASERPQADILDRTAVGNASNSYKNVKFSYTYKRTGRCMSANIYSFKMLQSGNRCRQSSILPISIRFYRLMYA
jgi:hypothetical protein